MHAGELDAGPRHRGAAATVVGLALVSAYVAYQIATERRNGAGGERRRHELLCGKLEGLIEAVLETERQLADCSARIERSARAGNGEALPVEDGGARSFEAAVTLQQLYFPNLEPAIDDLRRAREAHLHFLRAELATIDADRNRWRTTFAGDFGARAAEALQPFSNARYRCTRMARDLVEAELIP